MKVLVVGEGAREQALVWKLKRSRLLSEVALWPAIYLPDSKDKNTFSTPASSPWPMVAQQAKAAGFDFVVVGPEAPLAAGFADACAEINLPVFGPSQRAAQLESSKAFAKDLMVKAGVPTARFFLAENAARCKDVALNMLAAEGGVVLKASGLASGKGVFVCHKQDEVKNALALLYGPMRAAAEEVVVEELLVGRESSYFCFLGCGEPVEIGFAVDYKRLQDGNKGPNTGGMGCYTPVPWLPANASEEVREKVVTPLLKELARREIAYCGCLYVGLMWTKNGLKVVEFNVRLGDPEAQILAVHDEADWGALIAAKLGLVAESSATAQPSHVTLGVVMASPGYPYEKTPPQPLTLRHDLVNHAAGTSPLLFAGALRRRDDTYEALSGRVLTLVAKGKSFPEAAVKVYQEAAYLAKDWQGVQYRFDIGADA